MVRQLQIRDRLALMAVLPLLVVAAVAAGLFVFIDSPGAGRLGLLAVGGLAVTGVVAALVARSIISSLSALTEATEELAATHRRWAAGEVTVDELRPIAVESEGYLGDLAGAINAVNVATIAAADAQQGAVRAGLSNIVVNLARRSQTLLDRQVEYLDGLESSEEDPDRLGQLFKVDHLATRMRRNAESLMVLAGADPGRRRGGPVAVGDVLRVAMGEVESYQHIQLGQIDTGKIAAGPAVDLAHLTAELMENATQFSPPSAPVEVRGTFDGSGDYVITIADRGIGLSAEKLGAVNALLADPPELDLGMGRSLGFMVIGRLAKRIDATVTLAANGASGCLAVVTVPGRLFIDNPRLTPQAAPASVAGLQPGLGSPASPAASPTQPTPGPGSPASPTASPPGPGSPQPGPRARPRLTGPGRWPPHGSARAQPARRHRPGPRRPTRRNHPQPLRPTGRVAPGHRTGTGGPDHAPGHDHRSAATAAGPGAAGCGPPGQHRRPPGPIAVVAAAIVDRPRARTGPTGSRPGAARRPRWG